MKIELWKLPYYNVHYNDYYIELSNDKGITSTFELGNDVNINNYVLSIYAAIENT